MKHLMAATACLISFSVAHAAIPRKVWRPSVESVGEMLRLPPESRHAALLNQPDSVYDSLLDIANQSEQTMNMRWRALTAAALLRKEKSAPDLMKAANSDQWFMRNAALLGLSEFAPEKSILVAKRLIKDPALVVRSAAVDVLAKRGSTEDRGVLWTELSADYNRRGGQSLWIRSQIVKSLAEKPHDHELGRFSALLGEKDEAMQKAAIGGLEKLTGMKLGEGISSHRKVVQMWQNYFGPRIK